MNSVTNSQPREEYGRRLQERTATLANLRTTDDRFSTARGAAFLATVAVLIAAATVDGIPFFAGLLPTVVFVGLIIRHQRVVANRIRAERGVAFYETALQRIDDDWAGIGPNGSRYADPDHLYSGDLDLFGDGSLFQLLSRARTRLGEDRIADRLRTAADSDVIVARQTAVASLREELDLREEIALLDADVHDAIDQNRLRDWAAATPQPFRGSTRVAVVVLSILVISALMGWLFLDMRLTWAIAFSLMMAAFLFAFRRRVWELAASADEAESGLLILSQVLEVIERQEFRHERLRSLQSALQTDGLQPSQQIARLDRLIRNLNNTLRNQFFAMIGFLLALPVHLVHAVEIWRQHVGRQIPQWLDVVAEIEALVSLSGFAYENPDAVFPELVTPGPCFDAEQIGHPLLPRDHCVRNDLLLGPDHQLILISGSNMSGKSTLLRTVGVNAVLAQAGAPVRAKRLSMSPLNIASAMRVQDSLQDGRSLFYSVLRRIKAIVDAAELPRPLLYLLDEILQGTNSHDRRIGAEGVIRTLVERGAIGLVTTHDLALTEITDVFDGRADNCHFQDDLTDGKMTFDYQLRPGVVKKSNALELMRSMGLDV